MRQRARGGLTSGVISLMLRASISMVSSTSVASAPVGDCAPLFCLRALTCSLTKVGTGSKFWKRKSSRMSALNCR